MILLVLLSLLPLSLSYNCTKVNGIDGACALKLNQITLAGSRLSGCGAYGKMYFWSGVGATACHYATQDKSITEQLEMGVRAFDFDLSYVHKTEESLPYWEEGPVLVSIGSGGVAYSRSLRMALTEIRDFMNSHRDEVLTIRIPNYYPQTNEIRDHLTRTIKPLFDSIFGPEGSEGVQLTFFSTLKPLSYLVENNERLVLYLHRDFWGHLQSDYRSHAINDFTSSEDQSGYYSCHNPRALAEEVLDIEEINRRNVPLVLNWWLNSVACISEMAQVCTDEVDRVFVVWEEVIKGTHLHRPVNVVRADYVQPQLVRLVTKINNQAVATYKLNPW